MFRYVSSKPCRCTIKAPWTTLLQLWTLISSSAQIRCSTIEDQPDATSNLKSPSPGIAHCWRKQNASKAAELVPARWLWNQVLKPNSIAASTGSTSQKLLATSTRSHASLIQSCVTATTAQRVRSFHTNAIIPRHPTSKVLGYIWSPDFRTELVSADVVRAAEVPVRVSSFDGVIL